MEPRHPLCPAAVVEFAMALQLRLAAATSSARARDRSCLAKFQTSCLKEAGVMWKCRRLRIWGMGPRGHETVPDERKDVSMDARNAPGARFFLSDLAQRFACAHTASFFFAARDLRKSEAVPDIFLRVAASLCFAVFALSAHFEKYRAADDPQRLVFVFGLAYLLLAFHFPSWRDYILGTSVGLALPVIRIFGPFQPHVPMVFGHLGLPPPFVPREWRPTSYPRRDAILLLAITLSNMLLVLAVAVDSLAKGRKVRVWRALAGLGPALLFEVLIFVGFFFG